MTCSADRSTRCYTGGHTVEYGACSILHTVCWYEHCAYVYSSAAQLFNDTQGNYANVLEVEDAMELLTELDLHPQSTVWTNSHIDASRLVVAIQEYLVRFISNNKCHRKEQHSQLVVDNHRTSPQQHPNHRRSLVLQALTRSIPRQIRCCSCSRRPTMDDQAALARPWQHTRNAP